MILHSAGGIPDTFEPSNLWHPSASLMVPWCRLNECKTQCTRWMYTIPRHQSWYPDVASMRVKHNTNLECIPSLGINHGILMSPQCMQNTIHTLKLYHPSASIMVPWCRLNAYKTQYKGWIYTIPRHQSWYPDVVSMRVQHNTNIELIQALGINHGTPMSPQCVQNTIQALNLYHPKASLMVPC